MDIFDVVYFAYTAANVKPSPPFCYIPRETVMYTIIMSRAVDHTKDNIFNNNDKILEQIVAYIL